MASYNKFNQFTKDLVDGVHDFDADTFKFYLSNATPSASADAVKADLAEITNQNGYTAPVTTTISTSTSSGTAKVTGSDPSVITASGTVGPFQYVVLYNDTPTSPADPLIAWWDYGSAVTMANGDTFTIDCDGTNGLFTIA